MRHLKYAVVSSWPVRKHPLIGDGKYPDWDYVTFDVHSSGFESILDAESYREQDIKKYKLDPQNTLVIQYAIDY